MGILILYQASAIPPWHIHTAGRCTCAVVLHGCKWWYYPSKNQNAILQNPFVGETHPSDEGIKIEEALGKESTVIVTYGCDTCSQLITGQESTQLVGQVHAMHSEFDCLMIIGN